MATEKAWRAVTHTVTFWCSLDTPYLRAALKLTDDVDRRAALSPVEIIAYPAEDKKSGPGRRNRRLWSNPEICHPVPIRADEIDPRLPLRATCTFQTRSPHPEGRYPQHTGARQRFIARVRALRRERS